MKEEELMDIHEDLVDAAMEMEIKELEESNKVLREMLLEANNQLAKSYAYAGRVFKVLEAVTSGRQPDARTGIHLGKGFTCEIEKYGDIYFEKGVNSEGEWEISVDTRESLENLIKSGYGNWQDSTGCYEGPVRRKLILAILAK